MQSAFVISRRCLRAGSRLSHLGSQARAKSESSSEPEFVYDKQVRDCKCWLLKYLNAWLSSSLRANVPNIKQNFNLAAEVEKFIFLSLLKLLD